jgi:malate dehydrogenase (oxaloacetate-decarboxylating)(NADP+)
MNEPRPRLSDEEALLFHASGRPGKLEITPTKPLTTQRELSLAYSPGVAVPCKEIERDPSLAYDYTAKGNLIAVISNGTAVLGLGDLGALAAKPVMEGKAVLFKRFADIDGIDLEVDTRDVDEFVNCVRFLGQSFGGINLEDIKAPECFIIEQRLKELLDIPVFHDDQHGTAIISTAGLLNALHLTGRDLTTCRLVVNGAGAAGVACLELIKAMGLPPENAIMCDSRGVIYRGREAGMNQWKSAHAAETDARTLAEVLVGADVFIGCSAKGAMTQEMVQSMADRPIIFAMANPDPEILPEEVYAVRNDAIVATGRSDYPNQVNNVLGFPYIFRGALDVQARTINDTMKIAAAHAIAMLAREDVPDEVAAAYGGQALRYGPDYIIPAPFDQRLLVAVPTAVAQAAMDSGVARKPIIDMGAYRNELRSRLDPTAANLQAIFEHVRANPRRVVFAEGEEEKVIRAAVAFRNAGYGTPVLIGREDRIAETIGHLGLQGAAELECHNARLSVHNQRYVEFLYGRLQRRGFMYRDCQRMVNQDRNVFAACMVALGDADTMVTGVTRSWMVAFENITRVVEPKPNSPVFGLAIVVARGRTLFIADTSVHELPTSEQMADIAVAAAEKARQLGHEPRVAILSFSNFGNPWREKGRPMRDAVAILDSRNVDFEYDGEMTADMALDPALRDRFYPFCRLSGPANVLIMPGLHSAHISSRLVQQVGGGTVIGPIVMGLSKPAQIVQLRATVSDLINAAALAAYDAID